MTTRSIRRGLAGLSLVTVSLMASAQTATPPGHTNPMLDRWLRQATSGNPSVLASRAELAASNEEVNSAKLQMWPTLSSRAEYRKNGFSNIAQVEQPIWTFGRHTAQVNRAQASARAADAGVADARMEIAKRTISTWESWATAWLRVALTKRHQDELNEFESMMKRRVEQGISSRVELDLIASRMLQLRVDHESARSSQRVALGRMAQLTGETIDVHDKAAPGDAAARELKGWVDDAAATDPSALLQDARLVAVTHPSVQRAQHLADVAEEAAKVREAERWPTVSARYVREFGPAANGQSNGWGIGLQYAIGGSSTAFFDARAAQLRVESARQQREANLRNVVDAIQTDAQIYVSARDRAQALQAAIDGAQLVKESYARQFIAGRKSWLEVLNALREVQQSEIALSDAQAAFVAAAYRTRLLSGALPWAVAETQP